VVCRDPLILNSFAVSTVERFAREQFLGRGTGRELGELSEKARTCFRALAPESEQLERVREERTRVDRKKAVSA
jgi:hypothetical protein